MYKPTTIALLVFADAVSATLAAYAAASLAGELKISTQLGGPLWVLAFVVIVLLCLLACDCYRRLLRRPLFDVVLRVVTAAVLVGFVLFLTALVGLLARWQWHGPERLAAVLTGCAVLAVRLVFRAAAGEHEEPVPQGKAWRQ
jgi:FlaA1/EpsC-like NDP-sugar epimerase